MHGSLRESWNEEHHPPSGANPHQTLVHDADFELLRTALLDDRSPAELARLLDDPDSEISQMAVTCLGMVGTMDDAQKLSRHLHADDSEQVMLCEHALWCIWFRQAGQTAAEELHRSADMAAAGKTRDALILFDRILVIHPDFAEAYHQRGMARYLDDDYYNAVSDFLRTVDINPFHFSAMANVGHCFVQLGRYDAAQDWYLTALKIHPRLPGIRQVMRRLRDFVTPGGRMLDC
jgi:tetratricopeptide (TPR) repeat protein